MASKKSNKKPSAPVKKSTIKAPKAKAKVVVMPKAKANVPVMPKAKAKVAAMPKAKVVVRKPVAAQRPAIAKKTIPVKIAQPTIAAKPKKAAKAVVAVKPVAPVVAARPGKNPAGLSTKAMEQYRQMLLTKRHELLGDVSSMEDEALRNSGQSNLSNLPIHMADMGTDNYEQEFTLGLVEKDRNLLRDINTALAKINAGTYGICEGTNKLIAKPRLDAQPWARFSIEHARALEQRRMRA